MRGFYSLFSSKSRCSIWNRPIHCGGPTQVAPLSTKGAECKTETELLAMITDLGAADIAIKAMRVAHATAGPLVEDARRPMQSMIVCLVSETVPIP